MSSLLDGCYQYLVFIDPVNGYSKLKLIVKERVSLKSQMRYGSACLLIFVFPVFSLTVAVKLTQLCVEHILYWYFLELNNNKTQGKQCQLISTL